MYIMLLTLHTVGQ